MTYRSEQPTPEAIRALQGLTVLQFGTNWCGICLTAEPAIQAALEPSGVQRLKVEDGPGRVLGRTFRVKLWPTLIFLRDGTEVTRLVRPSSTAQVASALAQLTCA